MFEDVVTDVDTMEEQTEGQEVDQEDVDTDEFLDGLGEQVQEQDDPGQEEVEDEPEEVDESPVIKLSDGFELSEDDINSMLSTFSEMTEGKIPTEFLEKVPEIKLLNELAEGKGVTGLQYLMNLQQNARAEQVQNRASQLVAQGFDPSMAMQYAEMELNQNEFYKREQERVEAEKQKQAEQEKAEESWTALLNAFPEVEEKYPDINDFPPEMLDGLEKGLSPLEAYQGYLISEQQRASRIAMKDKQNKARMVGSARGTANTIEKDPFLSGLEG